MNHRVIRTLLIGGGNRCRTWARTLAAHRDFQVVGLAELREENRSRSAEVYHLRPDQCFVTPQEALDHVPSDAVLIVTPMEAHPANCRAALETGRHVLCEKPFVKSIEDGLSLAALARQKGLHLGVTQSMRGSPLARGLKRAIRERLVGEIAYGNWHQYRNRLDIPDYQKTEAWPQINAIAVHHVDFYRCLFGCEVAHLSVRGVSAPWSPYTHPAVTHAWFAMANGVHLAYFDSFLSHASTRNDRHPYSHGALEGSEGTIFYGGPWGTGPILISREDQDFDRWLPEGHCGDPMTADRFFLDNFRDAVRGTTALECPADDNLRTIVTLRAMEASAESRGRELDVAEFANQLGVPFPSRNEKATRRE